MDHANLKMHSTGALFNLELQYLNLKIYNKNMKLISIINTLILLLVIASSCQINSKKIKNEESVEIDLSKNKSSNQIKLSKYLKHEKYIALETTPSCLIGNVSRIEIFNDRIFILDPYIAKKLFVFDLNGKFLHAISKRGKGPGEYGDIMDFRIKNDTLYILNDRTSVMEYTLNGSFIKKQRLPFWVDLILPLKNNWGLIINSDKTIGYDFNYYTTTLKFNKEEGFFKSRFNDIPINVKRQVSVLNDSVYFFIPFEDKIFTAVNDDLIEKFHLKYPNNCIISDSELPSYNNLSSQKKVEKLYEKSISLSAIFITEKLSIFCYKNQNKPYLCFVNSKNDYSFDCEEDIINDIDSISKLPLFYSSTNDNKIISCFQRFELSDKKVFKNKLSSELSEIISKSNEDSNPIISIYSVNDNIQ
jgi:hypothetical protein